MSSTKFRHSLNSMQSNLLNFALMLTCDRDNAFDLLQDTTLKALDNEDKFTEGTNIKGWLFTIMRNIFINNYHRASYHTKTVDDDSLFYVAATNKKYTVETPENAYAVEEINKEIEMLPDGLKTPMLMFVRGYKYHEISEMLRIPLGTVKTNIFRARRRLQYKLRS